MTYYVSSGMLNCTHLPVGKNLFLIPGLANNLNVKIMRLPLPLSTHVLIMLTLSSMALQISRNYNVYKTQLLG